MTILIAGFGAFPGAPLNPCEALARSLDGARTASGERIGSVVLPVEWQRSWPVLRAAIEETGATGVIVFGLAARAGRLRLELDAVNARELGQADAAGDFPSGPGVAEGPERLSGVWPLSAAAAALSRAGIGFELSRDAGRYLCNDTYYRLCHHGRDGHLTNYLFVHTPLTDEALDAWASSGFLPDLCRSLPEATLREAALCLAQVCAAPVA